MENSSDQTNGILSKSGPVKIAYPHSRRRAKHFFGEGRERICPNVQNKIYPNV